MRRYLYYQAALDFQQYLWQWIKKQLLNVICWILCERRAKYCRTWRPLRTSGAWGKERFSFQSKQLKWLNIAGSTFQHYISHVPYNTTFIRTWGANITLKPRRSSLTRKSHRTTVPCNSHTETVQLEKKEKQRKMVVTVTSVMLPALPAYPPHWWDQLPSPML